MRRSPAPGRARSAGSASSLSVARHVRRLSGKRRRRGAGWPRSSRGRRRARRARAPPCCSVMVAAVDRWGAPRDRAARAISSPPTARPHCSRWPSPRGRRPRDSPRAARSGTSITLVSPRAPRRRRGPGSRPPRSLTAPAAYVNAIRRMSSILAVLLGRALFAEPDLGRRLLPPRSSRAPAPPASCWRAADAPPGGREGFSCEAAPEGRTRGVVALR